MKQKMKAIKRMKLGGAILTLIALALLLSGCAEDAMQADSSLMEEKKNLVVACLNERDLNGLLAIVYPNDLPMEDQEAGFQAMTDVWKPVDAKDVTMIRLNSQTTEGKNQRVTVYQGIYQFPQETEQYALYLSYTEAGDARGLTDIRLIPADQVAPAAEPLSLTVSRFATVCFILFSIVDVVRKKPRRYGWYIVLCIVVYWITTNGVTHVVLPVGALIYWCIRKKVLEKKSL